MTEQLPKKNPFEFMIPFAAQYKSLCVRQILIMGWIANADTTPSETKEVVLECTKRLVSASVASNTYFETMVRKGLLKVIGSDSEKKVDTVYANTDDGLAIVEAFYGRKPMDLDRTSQIRDYARLAADTYRTDARLILKDLVLLGDLMSGCDLFSKTGRNRLQRLTMLQTAGYVNKKSETVTKAGKAFYERMLNQFKGPKRVYTLKVKKLPVPTEAA